MSEPCITLAEHKVTDSKALQSYQPDTFTPGYQERRIEFAQFHVFVHECKSSRCAQYQCFFETLNLDQSLRKFLARC